MRDFSIDTPLIFSKKIDSIVVRFIGYPILWWKDCLNRDMGKLGPGDRKWYIVNVIDRSDNNVKVFIINRLIISQVAKLMQKKRAPKELTCYNCDKVWTDQDSIYCAYCGDELPLSPSPEPGSIADGWDFQITRTNKYIVKRIKPTPLNESEVSRLRETMTNLCTMRNWMEEHSDAKGNITQWS